MTELKKKAEKSYKTNMVDKNIVDYNIASVYVRGYIAGAIENGIQWHDLRKDPTDLPKAIRQFWSKDVLLCIDEDSLIIGFYDHFVKVWYEKATDKIISDVIAWKEIVLPELKELEK